MLRAMLQRGKNRRGPPRAHPARNTIVMAHGLSAGNACGSEGVRF
jgi:hypothetical protein